MKDTSCLTCLVGLLALTGCADAIETPYVAPSVSVPATWTNEQPSEIVPQPQVPPAAQDRWWKNFGDPKLNELVDEVLRKNNNLAAATFKVRQAQLKADLAEDQLLPDWAASASATNSRNLTGKKTVTRTYAATTTASYELDLWGKISRTQDAAAWEAMATEADRASTALALVGTTVKLYWKIGYLNDRIKIGQESIAAAHKTHELAKAKHEIGTESALEESVAAQNIASQEAALTQYKQQLVEAKNALAILFDGPPNLGKANPVHLMDKIPEIPSQLPASVLAKRPDLRAAEMRLKESLAEVDVTRASYLPSFSLTGSLGSSSIALTDVLKNPVGTFGAGLSLPFLNLFDMKKNIGISEAAYEQAVASFRQTLYQALCDVENALSARHLDREKKQQLDVVYLEAKKTEVLYTYQYRDGFIAMPALLDAQETRRKAESAVLDIRYTELTDAVTLYEAIGGDALLEVVENHAEPSKQ